MVNQKNDKPNPILFFIKWLILIPLILFLVFFGGCLPSGIITDTAYGIIVGIVAVLIAFGLLIKHTIKKSPHKEIMIGLLFFYGFITLMFLFAIIG